MPSAQLSYALSMPKGIHGSVATLRRMGDRTRVFAKRRHQVTIALGGNDAGVYSYTVSTPANMDPSTPVTVTVTAVAQSVDALLGELEAYHNHNDRRLANVARATADIAGDDLVIEAVRTGEPFTVTLVGNPETNMVATVTRDATPASARIGYAMADIDGQNCRHLQSGDTAATISKLGIMIPGKPIEVDETTGLPLYREGDNLLFTNDADLWIMPEVDMAVTDPVYVRVVAAGAEIPGAIRNTADGTDAVQMTRWQVLEAGGPTSGSPILLGVYP